jgi:hypothetical protein
MKLTRRARALLLFLSASGYTAWFSGLGERTEAAGDESPYPAIAATPHFKAERSIAAVISRDPFDGAPTRAPAADPVPGNAVQTPETGSAPIRTRASLGDLDVPNIADAGIPGEPLTLAVRATIVGNNPVAYVENGTEMDIVRLGDTLGEERVVKIDLRGLTFADGSRLDLPDSFTTAPPPPPIALSLSQRIDEIRKLLLRRQAASTAATLPANSPFPNVSATASYPTPGPLETVDSRGIPVGTNPTPDTSGPTPYPYPYPYAPAR